MNHSSIFYIFKRKAMLLKIPGYSLVSKYNTKDILVRSAYFSSVFAPNYLNFKRYDFIKNSSFLTDRDMLPYYPTAKTRLTRCEDDSFPNLGKIDLSIIWDIDFAGENVENVERKINSAWDKSGRLNSKNIDFKGFFPNYYVYPCFYDLNQYSSKFKVSYEDVLIYQILYFISKHWFFKNSISSKKLWEIFRGDVDKIPLSLKNLKKIGIIKYKRKIRNYPIVYHIANPIECRNIINNHLKKEGYKRVRLRANGLYCWRKSFEVLCVGKYDLKKFLLSQNKNRREIIEVYNEVIKYNNLSKRKLDELRLLFRDSLYDRFINKKYNETLKEYRAMREDFSKKFLRACSVIYNRLEYIYPGFKNKKIRWYKEKIRDGINMNYNSALFFDDRDFPEDKKKYFYPKYEIKDEDVLPIGYESTFGSFTLLQKK